jgi:amino acid transporter
MGERHLKRNLGFFSITMLGVGAMIGAGIFVLIGLATKVTGPSLLLAFLLNALIALIVGSNYAELGSSIPQAGGAFYWLKTAWGNKMGFYTGWMSWFANSVACALYATAFSTFAVELARYFGFPLMDNYVNQSFFAVGALLVLSYINSMSVLSSGILENIVTLLKIFVLLLLVYFAFLKVLDPVPINSFSPFFKDGIKGLLSSMGLIFIAFEGYEIISQTGEEVRDPQHNIPKAILWSIIISAGIYILVGFSILATIQNGEGHSPAEYIASLGELGLVEAAGQLMPHGRLMLLIAGVASTLSAMNATIYSSGRILFALSRNELVSDFLSSVHPRHGTPYRAIWASFIVMVSFVLLLPLKDIAASADVMFLLIFVLVCICVIRLRKTRPDIIRPYKVPFYPYTNYIGILCGLILSFSLGHVSSRAWGIIIFWLFLGTLYQWLHRRNIPL